MIMNIIMIYLIDYKIVCDISTSQHYLSSPFFSPLIGNLQHAIITVGADHMSFVCHSDIRSLACLITSLLAPSIPFDPCLSVAKLSLWEVTDCRSSRPLEPAAVTRGAHSHLLNPIVS